MIKALNLCQGGEDMQFRIKELRKDRRMSQEELSEKSGVSRTIVSFLENGSETDTKVGTLLKIADALDVPLAALFSDARV
jgi:transcriptional regulator with XRE-family HTH domain